MTSVILTALWENSYFPPGLDISGGFTKKELFCLKKLIHMHLEASVSILKECCNLFYFLMALNDSMIKMSVFSFMCVFYVAILVNAL